MKTMNQLFAVTKKLEGLTGSTFQLSQLSILLSVMASDPEPLSYKDVELRTGLPQTSVARNLRLLGTRRVPADDDPVGYREVGLGLVKSSIDPWDTRRYAAELTEQGRALKRSIIAILSGHLED